MTLIPSKPKTTKKIVIVFDICSSTVILENLLVNEELEKWKKLLIYIKNFLRKESITFNFESYKFLGDGWILLFPEDVDGDALIQFLVKLSKKYRTLYKKVYAVLTTEISTVGLTFGIEKGTLICMTMNHQREYIGRALNVAARLQSSLKDNDKKPQYKGLISRPVYNNFSRVTKRELIKTRKIVKVRRTLRNLFGGDKYPCLKLTLPL
jgi:hypothetical protein